MKLDPELLREVIVTIDGYTNASCRKAICNEIIKDEEFKEGFCNTTFDTLTCWPQTQAGHWAVMPCPDITASDHTKNASRYCNITGEWAEKANYNSCVIPQSDHENFFNIPMDGIQDDPNLRILYHVGFGISIVALVIALVIFLYFRSLRCLRNIIHCHLIMSFVLTNVMWVVMHTSIDKAKDQAEWLCKVKTTVYVYFHTTNFTWMFVEGMYLFSMVVWAFSAGKIKHWHYVIVGWGVPMALVIVWAILKRVYEDILCWLPHPSVLMDYVIHAPVCAILLCNMIFLITIVWVLVTKLRASTSLEIRQYRKAVRATLVLFPLLGLTYLLVFYSPRGRTTTAIIFNYVNAVLHTSQGLVVAVFYCFLNGEVQTLLRKKLSSIQDSRGIFTRHTKSSFIGSPARSNCPALSMTSCNGRQVNGTQRVDKHCHSETLVVNTEDEATEKML